jgi:hypothetical protein
MCLIKSMNGLDLLLALTLCRCEALQVIHVDLRIKSSVATPWMFSKSWVHKEEASGEAGQYI